MQEIAIAKNEILGLLIWLQSIYFNVFNLNFQITYTKIGDEKKVYEIPKTVSLIILWSLTHCLTAVQEIPYQIFLTDLIGGRF